MHGAGQFGVEGVSDLERASAFVAGYRSVHPLEPDVLVDAVRHLWWKWMTYFWQLEFHHDRDDHSCDDLFLADEALLHWWTERLDVVERVFAGHAQQIAVSLPEPEARHGPLGAGGAEVADHHDAEHWSFGGEYRSGPWATSPDRAIGALPMMR